MVRASLRRWKRILWVASAALLLAAPLAAESKRWFSNGDKVYIRQHGGPLVRVQEPDLHLARARRAFVKDHASIAADELEKAAAGFAYFADRAAGGDRKQLALAARSLEKLADEVRARRAGELTNFDRALADANRILAGGPPPSAPAPPPATR